MHILTNCITQEKSTILAHIIIKRSKIHTLNLIIHRINNASIYIGIK